MVTISDSTGNSRSSLLQRWWHYCYGCDYKCTITKVNKIAPPPLKSTTATVVDFYHFWQSQISSPQVIKNFANYLVCSLYYSVYFRFLWLWPDLKTETCELRKISQGHAMIHFFLLFFKCVKLFVYFVKRLKFGKFRKLMSNPLTYLYHITLVRTYFWTVTGRSYSAFTTGTYVDPNLPIVDINIHKVTKVQQIMNIQRT